MNEQGKVKADQLRAEMNRYACGRRAQKVARLQADGDSAARAELKRMRDIRFGAPAKGAGELWNPKGKQLAKGSSTKCDQINRGHRAKANQARGL